MPKDRREKLAEYAHAAWSGWMEYLFSRCAQASEFSSVIIPTNQVERWKRQMTTAYDDLPEGEKESDRAEADKMLDIIGETKLLDETGLISKITDHLAFYEQHASKTTDHRERATLMFEAQHGIMAAIWERIK